MLLPYSSPPAPKGGPWELAANAVRPGQGLAAAARCLSAARAAGIADSRQEMPRASLYGSVFPVKFFMGFPQHSDLQTCSPGLGGPGARCGQWLDAGRAKPGDVLPGGDRAGGLPVSLVPKAVVARARRAAPSVGATDPATAGTAPRCHRKLPQGCLVPGPAVNLASPPQGFIG